MKKFLGFVAVALIVGAPAFAQNNSTMTYHLILGGTPGADATALYNLAGSTETGPVTLAAGQTVVNWAARVEVGGTMGNPPVSIGGAANIVFDLKLHAGDSIAAPLVGPAFGIGGPAAPGFFSVVQFDPAGGAAGQQPAAFPWVFNVDSFIDPDPTPAPPYGRLFDSVAANGPNMSQYTYPSTYNYYRKIVGGVSDSTANTTTVTAASGTLMGMGAGYPDFDFFDGTPQRGGVGLPTDVGGNYCYQGIGNEPIAEGQINVSGLPGGTYTLELVAGTGNNVILSGIGCHPDDGGTTGAFAAAAATVTGSTIQFIVPTTTPAPNLTAAVSRKLHGAAGLFDIPLNLGAGAVPTESRRLASDSLTMVLTYDEPISLVPADQPAVSITAVGGAAPTVVSVTPSGSTLTIVTTAPTDQTCITFTVGGTKAAAGSPVGAIATLKLRMLLGDTNNDGVVSSGDTTQVKASAGVPVDATNCRRDLNSDGIISSGDTTIVKAKAGNTAPACP